MDRLVPFYGAQNTDKVKKCQLYIWNQMFYICIFGDNLTLSLSLFLSLTVKVKVQCVFETFEIDFNKM